MTEAAGVPLRGSKGLKKGSYNQHVFWGGKWQGVGTKGSCHRSHHYFSKDK